MLAGDARLAVAEEEGIGIKRLFQLVESFGQLRYVKHWGQGASFHAGSEP
ncbi:MAG: hypothetical protein ABSH29_24955 [Acidimicrobiales bacterium]|jgi:hypothetical protein